MKEKKKNFTGIFEDFANKITSWTGSSKAFLLALTSILLWVCTGSIFHYSDTWQLVINTSTTIITFLMVFLIQKAQNKDSLAFHLKLNELIATSAQASNRLISVESLTEDELRILAAYYTTLASETRRRVEIHQSHSIEEAIGKAEDKINQKKRFYMKKQAKPIKTGKKAVQEAVAHSSEVNMNGKLGYNEVNEDVPVNPDQSQKEKAR